MKHINIDKLFNNTKILIAKNPEIKEEYERLKEFKKQYDNLNLKYFDFDIDEDDLNLNLQYKGIINHEIRNKLEKYILQQDRKFFKYIKLKYFKQAVKASLEHFKIKELENCIVIKIKDNDFCYHNCIQWGAFSHYIHILNKLYNLNVPYQLENFKFKSKYNTLYYFLDSNYNYIVSDDAILTIYIKKIIKAGLKNE